MNLVALSCIRILNLIVLSGSALILNRIALISAAGVLNRFALSRSRSRTARKHIAKTRTNISGIPLLLALSRLTVRGGHQVSRVVRRVGCLPAGRNRRVHSLSVGRERRVQSLCGISRLAIGRLLAGRVRPGRVRGLLAGRDKLPRIASLGSIRITIILNPLFRRIYCHVIILQGTPERPATPALRL